MILLQIELDFYKITLIGSALGLILGLIPLVLGFIKKKRKYAMFGFLGSLIGGALLGIFLSIPIAAIFTWLILRKSNNEPAEVVVVNETPIDVKVENIENR
ncbi:MAG: hypothetical protein H0W45_11385 [Acidobacteria bacterium]|nr:hypothetical protein [Acidobacteriota bacterium]